MNNQDSKFSGALRIRLWVWRAGLAGVELLRVLGYAITSLASYAILDFFLAFPQWGLKTIDVVLLAVLLALLLKRVVRILLLSPGDMALHADQLLNNRRQPVLSAFELERLPKDEASEWQAFLIQKSVAEAKASLQKLPLRGCVAADRIGAQLRTLLIQAVIAGIVLGVPATANRVILGRIFFPWEDIPPYSTLSFAITPDKPRVLYGGTLELTSEIKGGLIRSPVYLMTRKGEHTYEAACFQESSARFTQRLEKVVDTVEFCFVAGKARSRWQRVELLMQPQISLSKLVIIPPAYTQLPRREMIVGSEEITGFEGSSAELIVTSNRPLDGGEMTLMPQNGMGAGQSVKGRKSGTHSLSFSWTMKESARMEVRIRDVQHTEAPEPLMLTQKIVSDAPPTAVMEEPASFALATPHSVIPLSASASDDLGLKEVGLARTMVGFRDRILPLELDAAGKDFRWKGKLELQTLGVDPGQVLELFVEARDNNPSMDGIGASEVVKIQIISEPEYAELLRSRITIEEFTARYSLVEEKIGAFMQALRDVKTEIQTSGAESPKVGEKLKAAQERIKETQPLLERLSHDFSVYDMEKKLGPLLGDVSSRMKKAAETLGTGPTGDPGLGDRVDQLLKEFGESEKGIQEEVADAQEVAKVAKLMRGAAIFKEVIARQKDVVRKLKRIAASSRLDAGGLRRAAEFQDDNQEQLTSLARELEEGAKFLPEKPEYDELKKSAIEFSDLIHANRIPVLMRDAVTSAKNQDASKANQSAQLALEALESMLSKSCNGAFGSMCEGKMKFRVPKDLESTLSQMLQSLLKRGSGKRNGSGTGGDGEGDSEDGYSTNGSSPLNTPVFGPDRTFFENQGSKSGAGQGHPGASDAAIDAASREKMGGPGEKESGGGNRPQDLAPEKYKDAIKKYFNSDQK